MCHGPRSTSDLHWGLFPLTEGTAMPQPADMLNLGFLSEYEQQLIMGVLQRDEELRRIEEKRVRSEESAVTMIIKNAFSRTL